MKVSLNWIKDYVNLPDDLTVSKLMHDLTMRTVEVEGAEVMTEKFAHIVVGEIEEVLPHPNADKLRVCRTKIGDELKEIICGGINLRASMKVAVAKPGARVRWHGEGDLVEIKNAKLRGVESYGMICASSEIGLFDLFPYTEPGTIMDLSACSAPAGTNLAVALGIDDIVLEIDNKSLTNRPDLWGHYGIAREFSAMYDLPLAPIETVALPDSDGGLRVSIVDDDRCARYAGLRIENVRVKSSSFRVQSRIWLVGMRPINALVDVTNYVMLAVGQPTHAFDSNNIVGGITVRRANAGERLVLLNGKDVALASEDLVIADDKEAVALAGIMGGSKDSVLEETTSVILEVANFNALGTRKTAQKNDLRTEASIRYEKGIDPQRVDLGISLAVAMFRSEFPEMKITGFVDNYPRPLVPATVDVSLDWLAKRMGKCLSGETVCSMLERLGFEVRISGDVMHVNCPTWRSTGDVSLPDDIMEEVARLYGYENFEQAPIPATFEHAVHQREMELERRIREYLSFRCGMQEIFTYPWVKDEFLHAMAVDTGEMLTISTPPAPDEKHVRSTLLPNLLKAVSENIRYYENFSIYELAEVFWDKDFSTPHDNRERLPLQRRHIAGAFVGEPGELTSLFRNVKGVLEQLARHAHMEPLTFAQKEKPAWAEDTVWLNLCRNDEIVGEMAVLSKKAALAVGIKQSLVMLFELDVDCLTPLPSRSNKFVHLPEFPQVEYDISMTFSGEVPWAQIESTILGKKGPEDLLRSVAFVDEYRGKQIESGKKSVTLRLLLGSDKKTLTSEEIEQAARVVSKRLTKQLGGEIRS